MNKFLILVFGLILSSFHSVGQSPQGNVIYIVDSIPVIEDSEEGNDIVETDIEVIGSDISIKNIGVMTFDELLVRTVLTVYT